MKRTLAWYEPQRPSRRTAATEGLPDEGKSETERSSAPEQRLWTSNEWNYETGFGADHGSNIFQMVVGPWFFAQATNANKEKFLLSFRMH